MTHERAASPGIPSGVTTSAGRIALDEARVYWLKPNADTGSRLLSAPKDGGDPIELAVTPSAASMGIAVDDAFVFLAYMGRDVPNPRRCPERALCSQPTTIHGPTGAVLAVPKQGGTPHVLVSDARDPVWVAVDGKHVYWADGAELSRVPREGGQRAQLLADARCRALALDATYIYCLGDGISRVPKVGGAREILVHDDAYQMALALGTNAVYFDGLLDVRRSAPRTACLCCGVQRAGCIEPDPMIDRVPILAAVPKAGGSPSPIVRETIGTHLVVDGRRAYWMASGQVIGVDLAGGASIQVSDASGAATGAGIAVDESRLYWVTEHGELRSAAK